MTLSFNQFAKLLSIIAFFSWCSLFSMSAMAVDYLPVEELFTESEVYQVKSEFNTKEQTEKVKLIARLPKKMTAVLLAVALGPFGVHRLYLGTDAKVPVIYTLTLGGGLGILPLLDIIAILSSPNLNDYINNSKVVMWAK